MLCLLSVLVSSLFDSVFVSFLFGEDFLVLVMHVSNFVNFELLLL